MSAARKNGEQEEAKAAVERLDVAVQLLARPDPLFSKSLSFVYEGLSAASEAIIGANVTEAGSFCNSVSASFEVPCSSSGRSDHTSQDIGSSTSTLTNIDVIDQLTARTKRVAQMDIIADIHKCDPAKISLNNDTSGDGPENSEPVNDKADDDGAESGERGDDGDDDE
ncbi:hypothetical protein BC939DRAFT_532396 [Gamsiella multidivaricata]|uniref:uncharacterized protein n=1 Tax=Gamsiella multidivaricata TaxID=101098 RepID=UPI0022210771|nr:uncharacterized protein BC939DRAFT_532396 [Gamsiella multidivaricata]KAI7817924.1 hypothetical protein BC939DRAFT_532396 [Gamsiella multidivaricata]